MKTLKLTASDFKETGSYYKEYIGTEDVTNYDGNIEIEANLGWVRFALTLKASGSIVAMAGTGIKAGEGIEAGWGIKAGWGIEAGTGIEAGEGIEAGTGIEAGEGIKAGWGIEAGTDIDAGEGIEAGGMIKFADRLFAGTAVYRSIKNEIKEVKCKKLEGGTVCYGTVIETGVPEDAELVEIENL
jgi:hypothetical protein